MRKLSFAIAAALCAPSSGWALGSLAQSARLVVDSGPLIVGQMVEGAAEALDCRTSSVQHTVQPCALKPRALPSASSVGRRVQSASLTVNFKGRVVNMSLAFDAGLGFDALFSDYKTALGSSPKVQYWADDAHLYASYIWIDGETEVEISRTLKGSSEGGPVRVYISSLSGNPDLSPEDAP
jgi:hypothetical protein